MVATIGVDGGSPGEAATAGGCGFPDEVRKAVQAWAEPAVEEILAVPAAMLREVSADIGSEIIESGILLTGGGALVPGLRDRLTAMTSIPVSTPDRPLDTVVRGLRSMIAG